MWSGCRPEGVADVFRGEKPFAVFQKPPLCLLKSLFAARVPCKDILLEIFNSTFQDREHEPFFALADTLFVHSLNDFFVWRVHGKASVRLVEDEFSRH